MPGALFKRVGWSQNEVTSHLHSVTSTLFHGIAFRHSGDHSVAFSFEGGYNKKLTNIACKATNIKSTTKQDLRIEPQIEDQIF
jgi:hypothetical protein